MIIISRKKIGIKIVKILLNYLFFTIGTKILKTNFKIYETNTIILICLLSLDIICIILKLISCIIFCFYIDKQFNNKLHYNVWKYSCLFFDIKKDIKTVKILIDLFLSIYLIYIVDKLSCEKIYFTLVLLISIVPTVKGYYTLKIIIDIKKFTKIKRNVKSNQECCICLDKGDQKWAELVCSHKFHYECIKKWNYYNKSCPVCRQRLLFDFI